MALYYVHFVGFRALASIEIISHCLWCVTHEFSTSQNDILELSLLNKSTVILIYDTEDILHLLGTFLAQATKLEELFITKGVWSCWRKAYVIISTWDKITIYFIIIIMIITLFSTFGSSLLYLGSLWQHFQWLQLRGWK